MKISAVFGMSAVLLGAGVALVGRGLADKNVVAASVVSAPQAAIGSKDKKKAKGVPPVLHFTMNSLAGKPVDLAQFKGKVVLIVNTASQCGFTPQYAGLEKLHEKYEAKGLQILGFPANDFGQQEPGSDAQIGEFCQKNYGVKFPMFSKIAVTGNDKAPLYKFLTESATNAPFAGEVQWNFEKFLVSRDGKIVGRFRSNVTPESSEMTSVIEAQLAAETK